MAVGLALALAVPLAADRLHVGQGVVTVDNTKNTRPVPAGEYGPCIVSHSVSCPFDAKDPIYRECWESSPTGPTLTGAVWALGIGGALLFIGSVAAQVFFWIQRVFRSARAGGQS
jgi:hypothetical protein